MSKYNLTAPVFTPLGVSAQPELGVQPEAELGATPPGSPHSPAAAALFAALGRRKPVAAKLTRAELKESGPKLTKAGNPVQPKTPKGSKAENPKPPKPKGPKSGARSAHPRPTARDTDDYELFLEESLSNGLLKSIGRKGRVSLNHLLDLSYEEPGPGSFTPTFRRRRRPSRPDKPHLTGKAFINANYRFIVPATATPTDPNLPLDRVVRVVVPRGLQACPICLSDDPVAPRMLPHCGHLMCLTCLHSLLDHTTEKHLECPLCTHPMAKAVLPVVVHDVDLTLETPRVGHEVVLRLLVRKNGALAPVLALRGEPQGNDVQTIPWYVPEEGYSRVMRAPALYAIGEYERERREIMAGYEADRLLYGDANGRVVERALKAIDEAILKAETEPAPDSGEGALSVGTGHSDKSVSSANTDKTSYFYSTALDSITTHYFLAPLDVRILRAQHQGNYSEFPPVLIRKVRNVVPVELTVEAVTSSLKYLSYLPIGAQLCWLECEWAPADLLPEVWAEFQGQISTRERKLKHRFLVEERNKVVALAQQEQELREFYERENDPYGHRESWERHPEAGEPGVELPVLEGEGGVLTGSLQYTVWGTAIPAGGDESDGEDTRKLIELLRVSKKGKGRKKWC